MTDWIKLLFGETVRVFRQLISNKNYKTYFFLLYRLSKAPRFTKLNIKVGALNLSIPDSASFLSTYKDLFIDETYAFKCINVQPRILDLGANIGLSVLYFKQLFPNAEITAYEADPLIFEHLKKNVHGNGFVDVRLLNQAAWDEKTTIQFSSEGADGGRAAVAHDANLISVDAVDIRDVLKEGNFNFLKMDIEGAEERVLPACRDYLSFFSHVFIEYHSLAGKRQNLNEIISLLTDSGFRIHIRSLPNSLSPFMGVRINAGFDMQLNIFAWRE